MNQTERKEKFPRKALSLLSIFLSLAIIPLCIIQTINNLVYIDSPYYPREIRALKIPMLMALFSVAAMYTGIKALRVIHDEASWVAAAFSVLVTILFALYLVLWVF